MCKKKCRGKNKKVKKGKENPRVERKRGEKIKQKKASTQIEHGQAGPFVASSSSGRPPPLRPSKTLAKPLPPNPHSLHSASLPNLEPQIEAMTRQCSPTPR